jgi:predicted extracellular nuclease
LALEHTAMVIRDVTADVIGVVEAKNRIALERFSAQLLKKVRGQPHEHVMVIDGNDERGIDVGLMSRAGYEIIGIRSQVDDMDEQGRVFSRDCREFTVTTPTGERLIVLVNHLKSKGNGAAAYGSARLAYSLSRSRRRVSVSFVRRAAAIATPVARRPAPRRR